MIMFDTQSLECFVAVAEMASFTKAADRVLRTQSAVSQQINKLEKQCGKPLFIRGKRLTLTADGEVLLSYARKIICLSKDAANHFNEPELHGEVRFGLPEDFLSVFLEDILHDFSSLHPKIILNIECGLTINLLDKFSKNEFDLVLIKMLCPREYPYGVEVLSEKLEWVSKKNLPEAALKVLPLVLSPQPCVYRARAISSLEKVGRKWRVVFSSHSYSGTLAAVRAGMGITVLPRNMIPNDLNVISPSAKMPELNMTHISLLKHDDKHIAVNSFENFVIDRLKLSS